MTMSNVRSALDSPAAKLGAYAVLLAVALGGGAVAGATIGPEPSKSMDGMEGMEDGRAGPTATDGPSAVEQMPAGLAVSQDGYTLDLRTPVLDPERPGELAFTIAGPDGRPVTDYDVEHDKELHLVVVGRDLAGYAHVHPARDDDGAWSVAAPPLMPGSYRVFADFTPAGGDGLTLGADLVVPGDLQPVALPAPSETSTVDDFELSFAGDLVAGTESELTVEVTRNGRAVTDLQPYLGALGHLVAIRSGDLAYLHVHPLDEADGAGGPSVRFAVEVPTSGTYRLFFDFSHGDDVRTAATTAVAVPAPTSAAGQGDQAPSDDHDEHGD